MKTARTSVSSNKRVSPSKNYVHALRFGFLTPFYDSVVRFTTRETVFKRALIRQCKVENGRTVLDLACGTGTLTLMLKRAFPDSEITGLDGDGEVLRIAVQKSKEAGLDLKFEKGLSFEMPFADNSFDHVVSSLFFHHLSHEDKLRTLSEIKRVLRPNGSFHIADWGKPSNVFMKPGSFLVRALDGFENTADNFEGRIAKLLSEGGFSRINETYRINTPFGTIRIHHAMNF